ncbi:hypothetical protein M422DRAFT_181916, partial [Sphaerobolus stellatus SS14]
YNTDLDSLLIFAGLFSAVNSAFIVNIDADLSANPTDTTNTLLMLLIHTTDNKSFVNQTLEIPNWTGPSSTVIWTQSLAYLSLGTSLLAAFGAVLVKQWLAHFKSTRFTPGSLEQ